MKKFYLLSLSVLFLTVHQTSAQSSIPIFNNINIGSPTNRAGTIYVNNLDASGNAKIGGTLDVAGITTLNKLKIKGATTFPGFTAGILTTDASGLLTSGPLLAGQIPVLPYLPLAGGVLTGNLTGSSATFNNLLVQRLQITSGTVATGNVLTTDSLGFGTWEPIASGGWSLTGNAGTDGGTNFIGTTDFTAFNVKVNGVLSGRIDPNVDNTFWGYQAGMSNTTGSLNTCIGAQSSRLSTTGFLNTIVGWNANSQSISGSGNTVVGEEGLLKIQAGTDLTAIGRQTFAYFDGLTNSSALGFAASITASNQVVLGNADVTSIGGQVGWTSFSDGRYKRNIKQDVPGLAFINQLQPITYTVDVSAIQGKLQSLRGEMKGTENNNSLKTTTEQNAAGESSTTIHTGFIAQDVEKTALKLGYNFSGVDKPKDDSKSFYGLRYGEFVVPLVKAVQELSSRNDSLSAVVTQLQDSLNSLVEQMNNRLSRIEQLAGINDNKQNSISALLSSARLFQNAPNPFSQSTQISYFIPDNTGSASIQITDMSGAIIKSVPVNAKGNGQLTLSTAQMPAGVYNYSLYITGNVIDTKKMVLIK
jgi:trimeric autotransporter adhesin